jgi:hypothetical protein
VVDRLRKNSVLANHLPGTALLLRGDGKHYFVKIGNREIRGGTEVPLGAPSHSLAVQPVHGTSRMFRGQVHETLSAKLPTADRAAPVGI